MILSLSWINNLSGWKRTRKIQVLFLDCKSQVSLLLNGEHVQSFLLQKLWNTQRASFQTVCPRLTLHLFFYGRKKFPLSRVCRTFREKDCQNFASLRGGPPPPPPGQKGTGYEPVKCYGDWYNRLSESLSWYFSANFCALLLCVFLCFLFLFNRSSCSKSPSLSDLSHLSQNCEFFKLFHTSFLIQMNTNRTVKKVKNKTVFSSVKGCNVGLWFSGPGI